MRFLITIFIDLDILTLKLLRLGYQAFNNKRGIIAINFDIAAARARRARW